MKIQENVPLAPYTTFRTGGSADFFCVAKSEEDLKEAVAFAKGKGLHVSILGGGSNVVVPDGGVRGLVVKMEMTGASFEENKGSVFVTAWAGEGWDSLVAETVEWGAWGIENLSYIPGTVGASPVQNIGAYGVEVMNVVESVRAIDTETGEARTFSNRECGFSYRDSVFKSQKYAKYAIISVTFRLSREVKPNLSYKDVKEYFAKKGIALPTQSEIREAVIEIRKGKFPDLSKIGTAGSFWKNPIICRDHYTGIAAKHPNMPSFPVAVPPESPYAAEGGLVKVPLAWILDNVCGLKGYKKGKVGLYEKQPLVLVAEFGATASEIDTFAAEVAQTVKDKTGIEIEREVRPL
ncbi:MAG: UDP-N-acetylmuramate dehydrogenase [Candidatus Taylorbacteria bacterium]|nr:UDP-N-acetylmuramate dehydrogenase [Candidatus Taylorbacteria bacterium]